MDKTELLSELSSKYKLIGVPKELQPPSNAGTAKLYCQDYLELSEDKKYGVFRTANYYLYDDDDGQGGKKEIAFFEGKMSEKVI